jgi:energy-coupling factor transporter ATP-binding protein EcfA2
MQKNNLRIVGNKAVLNIRERMCETADELLQSDKFRIVLEHCLRQLEKNNSPLLGVFENNIITDQGVNNLIKTLVLLEKYESRVIPHIYNESATLLDNKHILNSFVEYLYDYWRHFDRFIINHSEDDRLDKRPYRTFNETIEQLTHLIRTVYRHIQENITGTHPMVYRQVPAGAEMAVISLKKNVPFKGDTYRRLNSIPVVRQMLIYPPLVIQQPMNKRTGHFRKIAKNPLYLFEINPEEYLCYPARVGRLIILVYFHISFFELGFSMCNLFDLASDDELTRKPDGVLIYGVQGNVLDDLADSPTVFYEDKENDIFTGAIPARPEFGYFGYLKKMVLTIHNSIIMRSGNLPFHGAMVKILLQGNKEATVLMMGDTGAGKSETLEALRVLGEKYIRQLTIIADDMGSVQLDENGSPVGYGTEIGAFLRLDDLQPGYAYGHLDRSIIMNPSQTNARIVFPVTSYETVVKGHKIDYILYANNYEDTSDGKPVIERFGSASQALSVFRDGAVMSKGTTTSSGLVHSYFANIFGPPEYEDLHEKIAARFFESFFKSNVFIGQMRTKLGIPGCESTGPRDAATELLRIIGVSE